MEYIVALQFGNKLSKEEQKKLIESKFPVDSKCIVFNRPKKTSDGTFPSPGWNSEMEQHLGETMTVLKFYYDGSIPIIRTIETCWSWHPSWLTPHCDCPSIELARSGCTCGCLKREKIKLVFPKKVKK